MKLAELQQLFWRSVRYQPGPPELDEEFVDAGGLSGRKRIALYRNMYWLRQVNGMAECFPQLRLVLGGERFTKMVVKYITAHPSQHPGLERLGRKLSAFLLEQGEPSVMVQLSELEWARNLALWAPSSAVAQTSDVAADRFAHATLKFVPSLQRLEASAAVVTLWSMAEAYRRAAEQGGDPAEEGADEAAYPLSLQANNASAEASSELEFGEAERAEADQLLASDEPAEQVVIWRQRYSVRQQLLAPDEARAFALACGGHSVAEVCEVFAEHDTPQQRAFEVLLQWFKQGWVALLRDPREEIPHEAST